MSALNYRVECADCEAWAVGQPEDFRDFYRAHYRVTVEAAPVGTDQGCSDDPLVCLFGSEAAS